MARTFIVEKEWDHNSLKCVIINIYHGYHSSCMPDTHRCGYVGVSRKHPLYGIEYSQKTKTLQSQSEWLKKQTIGKRDILSMMCWEGETVSPEIFFDVHGGLTFSGGNGKYPVESDLYFFGFDCAHAGDNEEGGRSLEYCISECESLADQLNGIKDVPWMRKRL